MFDRFKKLISDEEFEKIKNTNVLVVGIGGVGGYAVESLIRSGIEHITLVDFDKIDVTNINRQIIALKNNIGEYKTDVFIDRIRNINDKVKILVVKEFITEGNVDILNINNYDYVVDACDTIKTKISIIETCLKKKVKFISCMGTGNKFDPSLLSISDIRKTSYDPIAKIIRSWVTKNKITDKIMVVSSVEKPLKTDGIGSTSFVPPTAGLLITSHIIKDILKR